MRGLRSPDMAEIIRTNKGDSGRALRWSNDIIFLPLHNPEGTDAGVTRGSFWYTQTTTGFLVATYLATVVGMTGCLNVSVGVAITGGATMYWELRGENSFVWASGSSVSGGGESQNKSISNFSHPVGGDLALVFRSGTAGQTAYIRINRIFLSARPFYAY